MVDEGKGEEEMKKLNMLYIVIAWSLLIFIGYNVLSVEAVEEKTGFLAKDYDWDEFYDSEISKEYVDEKCDASEDYKANKKACNKAYDKIEKQEKSTIENCESGNGKWVVNGYAETCIVAEEGKPLVLEEWMSNSENTVPEAYEEPVIEDWGNTVVTDEEEALKQLKEPREADENQVHGNAEMEYTMTESEDNESSEEEEQDEPEEQEEESEQDDE